MISIVTITNRLPYFSYQVKGLKLQTYKDFEWIIVDENLEAHTQVEKAKLKIKHVRDKPKGEISFAPGHALNTGILNSEGEIVYFLHDHVVPDPTCLERHWALYQKYDDIFISGLCEEPPPGLDYRMRLLTWGLLPSTKDIGNGMFELSGDAVKNWFAGRNDSALRKTLLDCNGFDERYDGCYGHHDADMGHRMHIYGLRYILDTNSRCAMFSHQPGQNKREHIKRSLRQQEELYHHITKENIEHGIYRANPQFNMEEEWRNKHSA